MKIKINQIFSSHVTRNITSDVNVVFVFFVHSDASKYSESKFSESKYSESKYPESNYSDSLYSESACASACASASVSACIDTKYKSVMVMSEEKDECVIATEVRIK